MASSFSDTVDYSWQIEKLEIRVSDWQSGSDLDSIRNSCDVFYFKKLLYILDTQISIWKSFCMATSHQIHMPQICHLFSPLNFKIFRIFARFWHKMLKCWYWTKFPRTKTAVVWVVHFLDGIFIISDRIFYIYDSAFIINIIKTWNHSRIMESARVA